MKKRLSKYLPEFVYGGIDGTVTTFAVVAGAIGASLSSAVILILGFANLFADGFSMAVSNYLSNKSDHELNSKKKFSKKPLTSAIFTFFSFIIVGFIPLLFFVLALFYPSLSPNAFIYSTILTAVAFFLIGAVKGIVVKKRCCFAALETLIIGSVAASLAFIVGYLLKGLA